MLYKKPWKNSLYLIVNGLIFIVIVVGFAYLFKSIIKSFPSLKLQSAQNLLPKPPDYIWQLNSTQEIVDSARLQNYVDYFEYLLKAIPKEHIPAEVYSILGFCYTKMGKNDKAIDYLNKAIKLTPNFFWSYYNLAIIHLKKGDYEKSSYLLSDAIKLQPNYTLQQIFESRIVYLPILIENNELAQKVCAQHLQEAYLTSSFIIRGLQENRDNRQRSIIIETLKLNPYAF